VKQFKPQAIIRNGGADPHYQDELADLALTYQGLWSIGHAVSLASVDAGCGVIDLVCGGYNPGYEEKGLYALLSGCIGKPLQYGEEGIRPVNDPGVLKKTREVINELSDVLSQFWDIEKIK